MTYDLIVIGAGPAGMSAAVTAGEAGMRVAILDAATRLGGQYYRQPPPSFHAARLARLHHGPSQYLQLTQHITALAGVTHLGGHRVWAVERTDNTFTVHSTIGERRQSNATVRARALLVATGGYDRQVPFPGWDLPGVLTVGAAQALLKGNLVLAGRRTIVAGSGPFLLPAAAGLAAAGATVVALCEASRTRQFSRHLHTLAANPGKLIEAVTYRASFLRHRVPVRTGHAVVAAHGDDRLTAVTVVRLDRARRAIPGTERQFGCDALAVGYGFTPQIELLAQLGCATRLDVDGSLVVAVDRGQRTDVPGVYAAGEVTGIGGAALAHVEGEIAGHAMLVDAGRRHAVPVRLVRRRTALRRFAATLNAVYRPPADWHERLDRNTILCRCEDITVGQIHDAIDEHDVSDPRTVKLLTRAGMGWCQGRVCGFATACLVAQASGRPTTAAHLASLSNRPIAQPVPLRVLAEPHAISPSVSATASVAPTGGPAHQEEDDGKQGVARRDRGDGPPVSG